MLHLIILMHNVHRLTFSIFETIASKSITFELLRKRRVQELREKKIINYSGFTCSST